MIRLAEISDIPDLVAMGREFHAMADVPSPFNEDDLAAFLGNMIANPNAVVFRSDKGGIGGVLVPSYLCASWISAIELFWWSRDGRGKALAAAFEDWASERASEVRMSTLSANPRAGKRLEAMGYRPAEAGYIKVMQWH